MITKMARAKRQQHVVRLRETVAGPGYQFGANEVLVIDGAIPAALAPACVPYDGVIPRTSRPIDAATFVADVEREREREQRPTATTAAPLRRELLVREFFNGDASLFDVAVTVGFPQAQTIFEARGRTPVWSRKAVELWAANIRRVAAGLR